MKPSDLKLPARFAHWQPHQKEAILAAVCSDKRFVMLNAPTGIGKSAIAMGITSMLGRGLYLTHTKPLQAQLMGDFKPMGLKELKGQNNYPCLFFDDGHRKVLPTCDDGPCHAGESCELKERGCKYYDALRIAKKSELVVENYSHWMTLNRYSEPDVIGKFDVLILDEAHNANDTLAEFVRVELHRHEIRKLLNTDLPWGADMAEWVEWAVEEGLPRARAHIESGKAMSALYEGGVSVIKKLKEIEGNLVHLSRAATWKRTDAADPAVWLPGAANDWIVEEDSEKVTFQPVWASGYAENYIFSWIPKVILVSATVTPRDAHYLGITRSQLDYFEYPSPFLRKRRPVYVVPTVALRRGNTPGEEKLWLNQIDRIVEKEAVNRKLKGIIHAVSYTRALMIKERSKHSDIMIVHDKRDLRSTVERFKAMAGPAVLISPSVGTGYDFPGDNCRFQIVAKLPFIDNRPAIVQARMKIDRDYLNHVTLVTLIQMVGRGVRSSTDWCRTYIIDDNWGWFARATSRMMPKWFKAAIIRVDRLGEVR